MARLLLVIVSCGLMVISADHTALAKQGFYLGLGVPYNTVRGNLSRDTGVCSNVGGCIPEIKSDKGRGYGILMGYGLTQNAAIEVNYLSSRHKAEWLGVNLDLNYTLWSFDFKWNFGAIWSLYPYLSIGLFFDKAFVKNGTLNLIPAVKVGGRDATYSGSGISLGAGVDHYFNSEISMGFGLRFRSAEPGLEIFFEPFDPFRYDNSESNTHQKSAEYSLILDAAYHF